MTSQACTKHADATGKWWCPTCCKAFCEQCIRADYVGVRRVELCPVCGARCNVSASAAEKREPRGFMTELADAFLYPVRGRGKYMLVAWGVFVTVANIVAFMASFFGIIIIALLVIYQFAYLIRIISSTAAGETDPPDWPELTDAWDDILHPLLLVIATLIICIFPTLIYLVKVTSSRANPSEDPITFALMCLGVLYLPMGLIAVALWETRTALNPILIITSIIRVMPFYVVAAFAGVSVFAISIVISRYVNLPIPIIGPVVSGAVSLYFLMVEMRICGLIYWCHEEKLAWFPTGRGE